MVADAASSPILDRHEDEEATASGGESSLGHEPLDRFVDRLAEEAERF